MKSGIVAIIGRPNVGKSTLLNKLAGEKVAIVSSVPQTTRNQIRAILNEKRGQVVFLDTPGMHVTKHALDRAMIAAINDSLEGVDVVLHLVDATEHVGEEEEMVMERLRGAGTPIILGLNKIDRGPKHIEDYILAWEKKIGKKLSEATERIMPIPLSALTGTNLDKLLDEVFRRLPEGELLYPEDILTDFPRQLTIQDCIREKLLSYLKEEVPFSMAVFAEEIVERSPKLTYVKASILVERDSQKAIVIGHNGEHLKKAGELARKELEYIYNKKFYLDLWVRVKENWKQDAELLRQIGYIL
ncbi:MAG: GTPase Era [Candidatus Omnitrophota bacterium]